MLLPKRVSPAAGLRMEILPSIQGSAGKTFQKPSNNLPIERKTFQNLAKPSNQAANLPITFQSKSKTFQNLGKTFQ